MHVVIMGCGRVGTALASALQRLDHSIAIVDRDADAFRKLGDDFRGRTVTGIGFDRDTLIEAGIEQADAFAAVSSGDNSNVISARVARENFGVERVVARIYDPRRAEVYQRLGIPTVATVRWTAEQMLRRIVPEGSGPAWVDPSGQVVLAEVGVPTTWVGRPVEVLEAAAGARVAVVTRDGEARLPQPGLVVQEGDLFHFLMRRDRAADVGRALRGATDGGLQAVGH